MTQDAPKVPPEKKKPVKLPAHLETAPRPLNADKRGRTRKVKNDPRYVKYY